MVWTWSNTRCIFELKRGSSTKLRDGGGGFFFFFFLRAFCVLAQHQRHCIPGFSIKALCVFTFKLCAENKKPCLGVLYGEMCIRYAAPLLWPVFTSSLFSLLIFYVPCCSVFDDPGRREGESDSSPFFPLFHGLRSRSDATVHPKSAEWLCLFSIPTESSHLAHSAFFYFCIFLFLPRFSRLVSL